MLGMLIIAGVTQGFVSGASGDSLTLQEAWALARARRPVLAAASAQVAGARAGYRVAGTVANPTLAYSRTESTPRQHLTLDQPLDWLLRRGADRGAARAGIERARADSAFTETSLARDVRVSFYAALAAREAERLVGEQLAIADTLDRIAATRLAAGDISRFEREQAGLELARARQVHSVARETGRVSGANLGRAVGAPPGESFPIAVGPLDDGLGGEAAAQRVPADYLPPMLSSSLADSAFAAAAARSAALARIPVPSVQFGAEWDDPSVLGNSALSVVGLSIPLPIWTTGGGQAAQARAAAATAAAQLQEARLEAARQQQSASIRLEETGRRARFVRDTLLPGARTLRSRALRAYRAGESGIVPVLDAIRGERDATLAALDDLRAFQDARAEWSALHERTP